MNPLVDSIQKWGRVYTTINTLPFLFKQMKRSELVEKILFSPYRSLVLSHLNYSATVLVSALDYIKQEMTVFQNCIFRIIGIHSALNLASDPFSKKALPFRLRPSYYG